MHVLLVAATSFEIAPLLDKGLSTGGHRIQPLITGPGMVATVWHLAETFASTQIPFDLALNAGIAGSFDPKQELGELCEVKEDTFGDFGAEAGENFLPACELGLLNTNEFPFHQGFLRASYTLPALEGQNFRPLRGLTVNSASGREETISNRQQHFKPQIESMEGASFFYACLQKGIPCCQIRAISNRVERRNKENWNIPLAVHKLNQGLFKLFQSPLFTP